MTLDKGTSSLSRNQQHCQQHCQRQAEKMREYSPDRLRYYLIKNSLLLAGKTFADIARPLRVTGGMVSHVASGRRVSLRVREAISREIGIPYEQLWER